VGRDAGIERFTTYYNPPIMATIAKFTENEIISEGLGHQFLKVALEKLTNPFG